MKLEERALRLTAALAIVGLISSQIPMRGQTALGSVESVSSAIQPADGYLSDSKDNSGNFLGIPGLTNRNTISGIALGLLGLGAYSTLTEANAMRRASALGATQAQNKPIYDVLKSMPDDFSEIVKLVDAAEQVNLLREDRPYTFFAPTNTGLLSLSSAQRTQLRNPANKTALSQRIKRHTLAGRYKISELLTLKDGTSLETLSGDSVILRNKDGILTLDGIRIVQSDIAASNGWIHPLEAPLETPLEAPLDEK